MLNNVLRTGMQHYILTMIGSTLRLIRFEVYSIVQLLAVEHLLFTLDVLTVDSDLQQLLLIFSPFKMLLDFCVILIFSDRMTFQESLFLNKIA